MKIEIDKDVPIAKSKRGGPRRIKYPWYDMEAGDSFFVSKDNMPKRGRANLSSMAHKNLGKGNYRTAIEGDGVRVWKIK